MGVAQIPTLVKWGAYLEQHVNLQSNLLGKELTAVLRPLEFTSHEVDEADVGWTLVHIR
jgi:hypothetical protein